MSLISGSSRLGKEVKNLPFIPYSDATYFGKYFRIGTAKSATWQFFNPRKRIWEYIQVQKHPTEEYEYSIILRNGWIVRKLESQERPHYYYLCKDSDIVNMSKNEALLLAYTYSPQSLQIPIVKKDDYLYMNLRSLYLPTAHYKALLDLSMPVENISIGEPILCFRSKDIPIIREILNKIRVEINIQSEFKIPTKKVEAITTREVMEIRKILSDILTLSYSCFLKKESDIERFLVLVVNREWDHIHDEQLREKLKKLGKLEESGDILASNLLKTLEKISSYYDWRFYADEGVSSDISGIVVGMTPFTFGKEWSQNYYKMIFSSLENLLYWPTTMSPTRAGKGKVEPLRARLNTVTLKKWRIYPYMGRLKYTGKTDTDVIFQKSLSDNLRKAFLSVLGIPSLEKILSERGYLSGFNLDLESWKGVYNLSRYFLAVVQILEPLEIDGPTPITWVRDIFGNVFLIRWDIDTYFHCVDDIHSFQRYGWISILLKNEFKNVPVTPEGISIFESVFGIGPRFVKKEEACDLNTIAVVKYFGFLQKETLKRIVSQYFLSYDLMVSLSKMIDEGALFEHQGIIYYVYQTLNKEGVAQLVDLMADASKLPSKKLLAEKWYMTWCLIREQYGLIHPLIYAKSLDPNSKLVVPASEQGKFETLEENLQEVVTNHQKEIKIRRTKRMTFLMQTRKPDLSFHPTRVDKKDIFTYVHDASIMLQNFGNATIEAMGRHVAKAHGVVTALIRKFAYMEPKVTRTDSFVKHVNGYTVRSVKFEVETYGF